MTRPALTERKMSNKQFFRNENAIFIAFYKLCDRPEAKRIAKYAGVSRSTLYRHHRSIYEIPQDYEDYLVGIYTKKMKKFLSKDDITIKSFYLRMLIFISANREVISVLFKEGHKGIITRMIKLIKPQIIDLWYSSGDTEKMFSVYQNAILGVIESWSQQDFSGTHLDQVLSDILYLTKASKRTLLPLK